MKRIPPELVAELRARTGAGMMDCKKALEETDGDLEEAVDVLRQKGAAKADKRAGRDASEGLIGSYLHHDGAIAALVELNCETDFVARLGDFKSLAKDLAMHVAAAKPIAVRIEDLSPDIVQRERQVYEAQVAEQKKPDNIRAKIVEGMRTTVKTRASEARPGTLGAAHHGCARPPKTWRCSSWTCMGTAADRQEPGAGFRRASRPSALAGRDAALQPRARRSGRVAGSGRCSSAFAGIKFHDKTAAIEEIVPSERRPRPLTHCDLRRLARSI